MTEPSTPASLVFALDRTLAQPLSEQIFNSLRAAIVEGRIESGARLPSWRDLATQLGVARGTVRSAYDRLTDEWLILPAGAAGTRVAKKRAAAPTPETVTIRRPLEDMEHGFSVPPLPFQMGVPAQDAFPAKLWARIRMRAERIAAAGPTSYADPRGEPALRTQIASYLAIARGIHCLPDQVIVTSGYRAGLNLAVRTLQAEGRSAWMEEPGYPIARRGLELAGMRPVPVPVDEHGLDVEQGIALAPDAALALVTPGQQAPLGMTLSAERRRALLQWAEQSGAWILEDDYLSELQLKGGMAVPALTAQDRAGRVIHIGTFSKTLTPSLGLGFLVAPLALAERFGEVAACLMPAPGLAAQHAVAGFMADGHYLRHLRHMKRLYSQRRDALRAELVSDFGADTMSGLAVLLRLPSGSDDVDIARRALQRGLAPAPLSPWYADADRRFPGLLLSVTNLGDTQIGPACASLKQLLLSAPEG